MLKRLKLKNLLITLAFPAVMFLLMELVCYTIKGAHMINSSLDVKTFIRNTGISTVIAFALSMNLTCGRFDLSLGAQRLAGTIVGGLLGLSLGLTGVWLLLFALAFGLLFGLATGLVFVITRVPPMVLGIGVGLIWECVAYVVSEGKGLNMFGVAGNDILVNTNFTIALVILVAAFVFVLLSTTRFGYEMRAIQGSQRIAQNSGINIFKHAVLCYMLAGGLVCIAGVIDAAYTTQMTASLGFTSNGVVVVNMFPMLLGGYIGRWSNQAVGVTVAALTLKIFAFGLTILELSEANSAVASMALFVLFLVYLANQNVFKIKRAEKARIALAREKMRTLGAA